MRKRLTFVLAILLSASCLFAQGNKETASTAGTGEVKGDIVFLTNRTDRDNDGTYAKLIAKFNEKYPDVKVEVQSATDYVGEMATRMQTDEYGDVCMIIDTVPTDVLGKYFLSLGTVDELVKNDGYTESYLYSKWNDGQVYGLANFSAVKGVIYNKEVFKEAGITTLPTSPDEFLKDLQLIKDNTDAIPYYTNANSGWPLDGWEDHPVGSISGDGNYKNNILPHDKNAFAPGSPHYVLSKLLYDIVKNGLNEADPTTCDWEASKGMLNRGEIGCMILGSWAISQMQAADDTPENVGYMAFPYNINGVQYASAGTDYCFGINKHTKYPEASRAFIDFMIKDSGWAISEGGISLVASDPMPAGLENFDGITFVVDKPATAENLGALDAVQSESGVTLYDNGQRLNHIIDIARGVSNDTFEGYMAELNSQWAEGVTAVENEK
jgi:ABC-type glycerol-3-phosphate transport system substrate-binding protein